MARKKEMAVGFFRTARPDGKAKCFPILDETLRHSEPFKALSPAARWLYLEMVEKYGKERKAKRTVRRDLQTEAVTDWFFMPYDYAQEVTGFSRGTVSRSIKELEQAQFISVWRGQNRKSMSRYAFNRNWQRKLSPDSV